MDILNELEAALQSHDWYYQYSDDYSVFQRGHSQAMTIESLLRVADERGFGEEVTALYAKYAPKRNS